ncbi:MAG: GNAT family N-acetyltransferase [Butyrivibrio sp.]|nr:GNAT family N-acetyltransferase [Butyrivibrio sp.]
MIRKAAKEDISAIEAVFYDAICWMEQNQVQNLWTIANTRWNVLSKSYDITNFFVSIVDNEVVGCMALTDADMQYWPEIPKGSAIYLHKLAVIRKYSRAGVSDKLIQYAKKIAAENGIHTLRLDCCADRVKLRHFYEKHGFQYTGTITDVAGYELALYVCDT